MVIVCGAAGSVGELAACGLAGGFSGFLTVGKTSSTAIVNWLLNCVPSAADGVGVF